MKERYEDFVEWDYLRPQRIITEAYENQYMMTNKQVSDILNVGSVNNYDKIFFAYGFWFKEVRPTGKPYWIVSKEKPTGD